MNNEHSRFRTYFVDGSICWCDDEYQLRDHYRDEKSDPISHVHTMWDGNPVIPPVGIRAQDCSHYWRLLMVLERRK